MICRIFWATLFLESLSGWKTYFYGNIFTQKPCMKRKILISSRCSKILETRISKIKMELINIGFVISVPHFGSFVTSTFLATLQKTLCLHELFSFSPVILISIPAFLFIALKDILLDVCHILLDLILVVHLLLTFFDTKHHVLLDVHYVVYS